MISQVWYVTTPKRSANGNSWLCKETYVCANDFSRQEALAIAKEQVGEAEDHSVKVEYIEKAHYDASQPVIKKEGA